MNYFILFYFWVTEYFFTLSAAKSLFLQHLNIIIIISGTDCSLLSNKIITKKNVGLKVTFKFHKGQGLIIDVLVIRVLS